jgi:glycerate 2-kinase
MNEPILAGAARAGSTGYGEPDGAFPTLHGVAAREQRSLLCRLIADAGVAAVDPGAATARLVSRTADGFTVAGTSYPLEPGARVVLLGAGKASLPIAAALREVLGERLDGGIVVVRDGEATRLDPVRVFESDHPLPTARSLRAGEKLLAAAAELGERDVAICCFTGGSSALASVPPPGVDAEEKWELHRLLLRSGLPVQQINAVRKHVSALKGGRLAAAIRGRIVNLTVSDVVGDQIDAITDPTVPDTTTADDAIELLRRSGLWEQVGEGVREHLSESRETPDLDGRRIQTVILASGATACEAMAREVRALGRRPVTVSTTLTGESREAGHILAGLAAHCVHHHTPWQPPVVLIGCGGETTVTLNDPDAPFAAGGPNQEMALAAALQISGLPISGLFIDSDGSDGGTELAGGLIDGTSAERAAKLGVDLDRALREHRATGALEALGDGLRIAPTGTNVNDLFVLVIDGEESG